MKNLALYESYASYYEELDKNGMIPSRKEKAARYRAEHYRETVKAVRRAVELLNDTEKRIIDMLYFAPEITFDDICDNMCLERSSVYRYRASALEKIACAEFGE